MLTTILIFLTISNYKINVIDFLNNQLILKTLFKTVKGCVSGKIIHKQTNSHEDEVTRGESAELPILNTLLNNFNSIVSKLSYNLSDFKNDFSHVSTISADKLLFNMQFGMNIGKKNEGKNV